MRDEGVERVARALAIEAGWDAWDTAIGCNDTLNGNTPEEEREYYRDLAVIAINAFLEDSWTITDAGRAMLKEGK